MPFDPTRTALLVIDVCEGGLSDAAEDETKAAFLDACTKTVALCHDAGVPVIYCNDAHRPGLDTELALWGDHGLAGTTEAQTAAALGPQPEDITIPKRRYSAFFQTDLDLTLRELGVDTVVAIGWDTNICVLHTLASAFFLNYRSVCVADATMTFLIGDEAERLEYFRRCFGTEVVSYDEFEAAMKGAPDVL